MTNSSRGVKILILNEEGMKEKKSYERRDYEAVADDPQSKGTFTPRAAQRGAAQRVNQRQ